MTDSGVTPRPPTTDRRASILSAALRVIAQSGLHNASVDAVAREARVAAGTLYRYFASKEAMINALYLEVLAERTRAIVGDLAADAALPDDARAALSRTWFGHARWHLEHPDASNLLVQCRRSGILTPDTREAGQRMDAEGLALFREGVARGLLRDLPHEVFWALVAGPIFVLSEMREAGELEVTDDVLRATFEGVCRSVLPTADAGANDRIRTPLRA